MTTWSRSFFNAAMDFEASVFQRRVIQKDHRSRRGQHRCREERLDDRIRVVLADAGRSGLPMGGADFVWG